MSRNLLGMCNLATDVSSALICELWSAIEPLCTAETDFEHYHMSQYEGNGRREDDGDGFAIRFPNASVKEDFNDYGEDLATGQSWFPIGGGILPHLSMNPKYQPRLVHPGRSNAYGSFLNSDLLGPVAGWPHIECSSGLNVAIANHWKGDWTANNPPITNEKDP